MGTRVGINGFGRVGRQSLKAMLELHPDELEVVAVNDITDTKTNAQGNRKGPPCHSLPLLPLPYDSTYGRFPGEVEATSDSIIVNGHSIKVLAQRDPAQIPWGDLGVDLVIESTGHFTEAEKAAAHLRGGVRKVMISAPAKGEEVNDAFKAAATGALKGILDYSEEPLVSSDLRGDSHSAIIDGLSTMVLGGTMVKVIAWYDNEWGYSCRIADLAAFIAGKGF